MSEIIKAEQKRELSLLEKTNKFVENLYKDVANIASIEGTPFTEKEKAFAFEILQDVNKTVMEGKHQWGEIDLVGSDFHGQVKSFARLGFTTANNELYVVVRNNNTTGKKEIKIDKQYQAIEKELIKWSSKKIIRFLNDIVCKGDEVEKETDFLTGINRIVSHKKNKDIDRNVLDNIIGAYAIAYVKENDELVPYTAYIEKERITTAYNLSPTKTKKFWNDWTQTMVKKTAIRELHKQFVPFIDLPIELKEDWRRTKKDSDWIDIETVEEEVEKEIKIDANSGEVLDFKEEVKQEIKEETKEEQPKNNRGF